MEVALRGNIEAQLERLLSQLEDIEENKEHFSAEEYERIKKDTKTQLAEFEDSLQKTMSGNLTLQSELEATKLAIRAAISDAFKTPQVIRLFAQKQPAALRRRLDEIDRDVKLGKVQFDDVAEQAAEILMALKRLGEPLAAKEETFLTKHRTATMSDFEAVTGADEVRMPVCG
uniref:Beta-catenin-interacting ICAT domain-containing protein n=1 Tax=Calcidiscus leptoporus TaxID=127549 RepID=A0A7S0NUA9_9EUKA|mmetsp:Transcript_27063/g.63234  ORF Transcript_27063/g.63234 Transcript_27063/m.63234 type:complete len:173 (+) Transcript_27063:35-553(+)|eukprot:CAMPEP_0119378724 /NCGR_PEP_ID=MMETSP1334-20130426/49581_1 /TAXON_ID=127549 /ORGANISM="Calcidiscus leptoporus, Strain RCC1130" /LENGTH=172 /DNA_ID=CAMNT_0007398019 /DNA_START=35 /DNA_END=553 /DNA_ORIENTATION=+